MSSPGAPPAKPVRGLGPVIVVILIFIAAALGYYQIIYYPPNHTSTTTQIVPPNPHPVNVTILPTAVTCQPNCNNKTYSPDIITVVIGYNATIFWRNSDSNEHTVTANSNDSSLDPRFTSFGPIGPSSAWNNILPGKSVNFTFIKPGSYAYFCSYHSWMIGTVIVKAGTNSSASSSGSGTTSVIGPLANIRNHNLLSFFVNIFGKESMKFDVTTAFVLDRT
jgi:plastocyanin